MLRNLQARQAINYKQKLPHSTLAVLELQFGMELLSIRSSDIAFTMGAKGPLLEKAHNFQGSIEKY